MSVPPVADPNRQTCPTCQRTNFTAAGLLRHKCRPPGPGEPVAPAVIDATDAEVLSPAGELEGIAEETRGVIETLNEKRAALEGVILKHSTDMGYDLVEIGWCCLRAKETIDHGMTGQRNASKNETETVSVSISEEGFTAWIASSFSGDLPARNARNYMNAARNLGLTAASTQEDVHALRAAKALEGKRLKDLYRSDPALTVGQGEDAALVQAEAARQRWRNYFQELGEQGLDKKSWAYLEPSELEAFDGLLLDLRREIGTALKAKGGKPKKKAKKKRAGGALKAITHGGPAK